jgi:NAD(P)-dependent dehydrogenase (short-subunit alcohol dehydrogenase family)
VTAVAEIRLDGQVALVTGGGRGIGRAICLALAAAGAAVAVCARSADQVGETARLVESAGGSALAAIVDVCDRQAVADTVERVTDELGPIDLLVNNAGIFGQPGPLADADPDHWWRVLEVNLRGPLYCSRAVLPGMIARGRGRIVNISSDAGFQAFPMASAYAVSKVALYQLSENLAAETAEQGISVFAIYPGLVHTDMVDAGLHSEVPSIKSLFRRLIDEGDNLPPERAAEMVVFLASGQGDALSGRFFGARDDEWALVARAGEIRARDLYVVRPRV